MVFIHALLFSITLSFHCTIYFFKEKVIYIECIHIHIYTYTYTYIYMYIRTHLHTCISLFYQSLYFFILPLIILSSARNPMCYFKHVFKKHQILFLISLRIDIREFPSWFSPLCFVYCFILLQVPLFCLSVFHLEALLKCFKCLLSFHI